MTLLLFALYNKKSFSISYRHNSLFAICTHIQERVVYEEKDESCGLKVQKRYKRGLRLYGDNKCELSCRSIHNLSASRLISLLVKDEDIIPGVYGKRLESESRSSFLSYPLPFSRTSLVSVCVSISLEGDV